MKRYLCIHGHFYQPPRENPWIDEVEEEGSAHPYHDWNERILAECYLPNSAARIVDHQNRILDIRSNYEKISFNFGPTLLSWMERARPETYRRILDADRVSLRTRSGHGNALAQVYNHLIMPLASRRDKATQVRWGIADFESRFRRKPEGMWLPETAVDLESLQVLAEEGIRFTILAPHQAKRIRPITPNGKNREDQGAWQEVGGTKIDPSRAYRCFLADGLYIDLFFYDGPISHAVAFDQILRSGELFVERLRGGFSDNRDGPQLVHMATDGESYGHHFPHGDMALAYTLMEVERQGIAELTNYGEFLSKHPPMDEVEIVERSSWSCFHGVERWRSNCGCRSGGEPGWNQEWRRPLRIGLDALKESLDSIFQERGKKWFKDPWLVRDHYITLIRKREERQLTSEAVSAFFERQGVVLSDLLERTQALKLLEMQRNALLMFTSCGWFFDDISGLEATQVLKYAGRAIQLAKEVDGIRLDMSQGGKVEGLLLEHLKEGKSNFPDFGTGADIYYRFAKSAMIDMERIVAHFAITSLFEDLPKSARFSGHRLELQDDQRVSNNMLTLAIGRIRVTSEVTLDSEEALFGVLYFGGFDFHCTVGGMLGIERYERMKSDLIEKFNEGSQGEVIRGLYQALGEKSYRLNDLLIGSRREVLRRATERLSGRDESLWRRVYLDHRRFMLHLKSVGMKIPNTYLAAAEQVLNEDLKKVGELPLTPEGMAPERMEKVIRIMEEVKRWGIKVDTAGTEKQFESLLHKQMREVVDCGSRRALEQVNHLLEMTDRLGLEISLWEAQNLFHAYLQRWKGLPKTRATPDRVNNDLIGKLAIRLSYAWDGLVQLDKDKGNKS